MSKKYWYISIVNVFVVRSGGKEQRVPGGFWGAMFLEVDAEDELEAVQAAQKKFKLPRNASCEVWRVSEMPPPAFQNRILSEQDLAALDRTDAN